MQRCSVLVTLQAFAMQRLLQRAPSFSWFVCIPIVYFLAPEHVMHINGQSVFLADAPIRKVFLDYVRHIGIGMLAMAGIIGLLNMSKVVASVVKNAVLDIFSSKTVDVNLLRTQRDVPTSWIGAGILLCTVLFAAYSTLCMLKASPKQS